MPGKMWTGESTPLNDVKVLEWRIISEAGRTVSFLSFLTLLEKDEEFRNFYNGLLASTQFEAFRWEIPALVTNNQDEDFRFVTIDAPSLSRRADRTSFAEHFHGDDQIAVFSNLGGDATMIVPTLPSIPEDYVHLADFVRAAPETVRSELWRTVGVEVQKRIGNRSLWLNTAGGGVAWLHVRIDSQPKYYHHRPYTTPS